jgi:hypothetical protein
VDRCWGVTRMTELHAKTWVAWLSSILLAVFGLDYYSLIYGFWGALMALVVTDPLGKWRAMLFVALSTLIGAVIGNVIVTILDSQARSYLFFGCLLGGFGAQAVLTETLKALLKRIKKAGG